MTKRQGPGNFDYQQAAYFAFRNPPSPQWFDKGRCKDVPAHERPEDIAHHNSARVAGQKFVSTYCGPCTVKISCTVDAIQRGFPPEGPVVGAMQPDEAHRVVAAALEIEQHEDLDAAAAALGRDLRPRIPVYMQKRAAPPAAESAAAPAAPAPPRKAAIPAVPAKDATLPASNTAPASSAQKPPGKFTARRPHGPRTTAFLPAETQPPEQVPLPRQGGAAHSPDEFTVEPLVTDLTLPRPDPAEAGLPPLIVHRPDDTIGVIL